MWVAYAIFYQDLERLVAKLERTDTANRETIRRLKMALETSDALIAELEKNLTAVLTQCSSSGSSLTTVTTASSSSSSSPTTTVQRRQAEIDSSVRSQPIVGSEGMMPLATTESHRHIQSDEFLIQHQPSAYNQENV
jgi:septal ring factor EnvC (AmiA/AmiB activator)